MEVITGSWAFQNVMSWVGIWFTAMSAIAFSYLIYYVYFREKAWIRAFNCSIDRFFSFSKIISVLPFLLALLFMGFVDLALGTLITLARTKPRTTG